MNDNLTWLGGIIDGAEHGIDSLDNAEILCCGREEAMREAFTETPRCAVCGLTKRPIGRASYDIGLCASDCSGYYDEPYPLNISSGEQIAMRRASNIGTDVLLPTISRALVDVAEAAAYARRTQSEDWIDDGPLRTLCRALDHLDSVLTEKRGGA